jgi:hypothetical protein
MARAEVPKGKEAGIHVGRVAVCALFPTGQCRPQSTPTTANVSIARTAMAMPAGPRFLPQQAGGLKRRRLR